MQTKTKIKQKKQVITVTSVNEHEEQRELNKIIICNLFKSITIDPIFRNHLPVDIINFILDALLSV